MFLKALLQNINKLNKDHNFSTTFTKEISKQTGNLNKGGKKKMI